MTGTRPLAVVDGDDTLWLTEWLYDEARAECAALVARAGFDAERWDTVQRALDVRRADTLGLSPARFPGSCALAVAAVVDGGRVPRHLARRVREVAATVFTRSARPVPGAADFLARLRERATVVLCTQGDLAVQGRRVAASGLSGLVDAAVIVPAKSPAVYRALAARAEAAACLSIGNSVRSDVVPAVAAGYDAVLVDSHVWERERSPGATRSAPARLAGSITRPAPRVAADLTAAAAGFDAWRAVVGMIGG